MSEEIRKIRLEKADKLRERGIEPYAERFERSHSLAEAGRLAEGTEDLRLAGRVVAFRDIGKLVFAHLQDFSGGIQIALQQDSLGGEAYKAWKKALDIGDFVGVEGEIFRTRRGEITLRCKQVQILSKSLRPLPEKWHGLSDREAKYRQRYLDLIASPESRERFRLRTALVRAIRRYLDDHGFEEVETPILAPRASGALARPFVTHHEALGVDLFLRIAPETYLKRLVVGGYEKVYEFARCFRNEGVDPTHLQDFTMLEYYVAYWNFQDNMRFTREMLQAVIPEVIGGTTFTFWENEIDIQGDWPRVEMLDGLQETCGLRREELEDTERLREVARAKGVDPEELKDLGRIGLVDTLFKKVLRSEMIRPTFVTGHPIEMSPLARRSSVDPAKADRFQLVIGGWEVVNAYSELIDPVDQRRRLEEQSRSREEEQMVKEEDFLLAMEYGLPPVSGFGLGVDRLAALISGNENLRDVVLFPLLRPGP